jgi:hypothetical protein
MIARLVNLALMVVFPVAWFAPLIRTGLLPEWQMPEWLGGRTVFTLDEVTVISGLQALWDADALLAMAVTFFALVAPMLKCLGTALIQWGWLSARARPAVALMAKLAMADIFILSIWIIIAKGIGVGQIEVDWGLYLFTGAVVAGLAVSLWEGRRTRV